MNYFRNLLNNDNMNDNMTDEIDELFERFVEHINNMSYSSLEEQDSSFRLNQSIINNAYLLRRTMELSPLTNGNGTNGHEHTNGQHNNRNNIRNNIRNTFTNEPIYYRNYYYSSSMSPPPNSPSILNTESLLNFRQQLLNNRINSNNNNNNNSNVLRHFHVAQYLTNNIFSSLFDNFNDFIEEQLNLANLEDVKVTLTEEEFNNLETNINEKELLDNKQCNICLEDIRLEDKRVEDKRLEDKRVADKRLEDKRNLDSIKNKLIRLKCSHIYHAECIKEWLTKQSTKCPTCRTCCRST